jgi:hypothetical protein
MAQQMVGQHEGHHGLAHRHRANADAGVVAAFGDHLDRFAIGVDRAARGEDGAGGFNGEARNDRLFDHIRDFIARRAVEIIGLCLLVLTAATATALLTWNVADPSLNHVTSAPVRNFLGLPGAIGADLLMQLFGLNGELIPTYLL